MRGGVTRGRFVGGAAATDPNGSTGRTRRVTVLTFREPAEGWLWALPLGNGRLGAMCYGGSDVVRFDINDETAWSGGPRSEVGQPHPSAADAAALLQRARQSLVEGSWVEAEDSVKAMQSDYSQSYLPFATVTLCGATPPAVNGYRRALNLDAATHEVRYRAGGREWVHSTIASSGHGVLMHVIEGATDAQVDISTPLRVIEQRSAATSDGCDTQVVQVRLPSDVPPTHAPGSPPLTWSDAPGAALEGAIATRTVRERSPEGADRLVVFVATETTFTGLGLAPVGTAADAAARALARLDAAVARGSDAIAAEHRRDHGKLFSRVSVRLGAAETAGSAGSTITERLDRAFADPEHPLAGDPGLAAVLFDYGRYLLLACSRPGGLPATLQGIWNDSMQPPWSSNYTLNINLQMNYWQANVAALPETARPLIDFVVALAAAGESTAARLYGSRGWVAHHNSDAWLFTAPAGGRSGDPAWAFWPMAAPWLVRQLWDGVEFGMIGERELRERLWPVIRGAAEFGLDWLVRMPDGAWGTIPSTSPENSFLGEDGSVRGLEMSSAMDLSLLRDLFEITVDAAARIGEDAHPVIDEIRARLADLPAAPPLTDDGSLLEWSRELDEADPQHRHVSPLYFVYPGRGVYDEAHRNAAVCVLERRGDASTGWSLVWKLALWARLHSPRKVSDLLRLYFQPASADRGPWAGGLYPNLFAAHPPFQIDGNLGYVAALAEVLLQSHAGGIDLLPALPPEFTEGEVRGLVARPGVSVDIRWSDGALERASLTAAGPQSAGTREIRYGGRSIRRRLSTDSPTEVLASDFGPPTHRSAAAESEI